MPVQSKMSKKHWILRVGTGENFKNSKHSCWGLKGGSVGQFKAVVKKMNAGDILWFITSKKYGGIAIGMAEFITFYDRDDEPLVPINTYSNIEQGWYGPDEWNIQINYKNLYNTEKQNIKICLQTPACVIEYITYKEKIEDDLVLHYNNYVFYIK